MTARDLQQAAIVQQDLLRTAKTEEDNYLLYLRKQEEARINDALDARGILNVAIAEPATVPALPARSFLLLHVALYCFWRAAEAWALRSLPISSIPRSALRTKSRSFLIFLYWPQSLKNGS